MQTGPLISEKALERAEKLFGKPDVFLGLASLAEILREKRVERSPKEILRHFNRNLAQIASRENKRLLEVIRYLLIDSPESETEKQRLLLEINGVSEPATVPLQTPRARVTPESSGRDGDKEKHQLS